MLGIIKDLRERIIQTISAREYLTADTLTGSAIVKVYQANKWDTGQEVVLRNDDIGEGFTVRRYVDKHTLELDRPASHDWRVADRAQINRAEGHNYLKFVLLGDQEIIPAYPAITLEAGTKTIEWMTIPGTTDEFTISISTYILDDSSEKSYELMMKYTSAIEEMLMNNLHPDISAETQPILVNLTFGETLIPVPDATIWDPNDLIVINSIANRDIIEVKRIVDATTIELTRGLHFAFYTADNLVAKKLRRYIYDSRVTNIEYGYLQKGSAFLKASRISWYAKEERTRLQPCQPQKPPFLPME